MPQYSTGDSMTGVLPLLWKPGVIDDPGITTGQCFCIAGNTCLRTSSKQRRRHQGAIATKWCVPGASGCTFSASRRCSHQLYTLAHACDNGPFSHNSSRRMPDLRCPAAFAGYFHICREALLLWAWRGGVLIPQNNSTQNIYFYDPVVLSRSGRIPAAEVHHVMRK